MIVFLFVAGFASLLEVRLSVPETKMFSPTTMGEVVSIKNAATVTTVTTTTTTTTGISNSVPATNYDERPTPTAQMQRPMQRPLKFYAIHIGPSKTGTSSIQKELARNPFGANTLGEDNVIYVGKRNGDHWPDPNKDKEIRRINGTSFTPDQEVNAYNAAMVCMEEILENYYSDSNSSSSDRAVIDKRLETDEETRASLRKTFTDECWTGKQENSFEYMLDSSIVDSNEGYSYRYRSKNSKKSINYRVLGRRFRIFDILGYERLVVVGAYRRYAEWLASAYTQSVKKPCMFSRLKGLKKTIPCTSFEEFLNANTWHHEGDEKYNIKTYVNIHLTLPATIESGPSKLESKILNYFQLPKARTTNENGGKTFNSITTELYCDALGTELTPSGCNHGREIANHRGLGEGNTAASSTNTNTSSLVVNKGSTSDVVYQHIVAAGFRLGFLVSTDDTTLEFEKNNCKGKSVWCDSLQQCSNDCVDEENALRQELENITSDGKITIIGTNSSNIKTWKDLSDYHTGVQKLTWTKSLPIRCLSRKELKEILKRSLELEEMVVPEFYATPLGKDEHERLFWDVWVEEKNLFCWVDIHKLFHNAKSWNEIVNERMVNYDWNVGANTQSIERKQSKQT